MSISMLLQLLLGATCSSRLQRGHGLWRNRLLLPLLLLLLLLGIARSETASGSCCSGCVTWGNELCASCAAASCCCCNCSGFHPCGMSKKLLLDADLHATSAITTSSLRKRAMWRHAACSCWYIRSSSGQGEVTSIGSCTVRTRAVEGKSKRNGLQLVAQIHLLPQQANITYMSVVCWEAQAHRQRP